MESITKLNFEKEFEMRINLRRLSILLLLLGVFLMSSTVLAQKNKLTWTPVDGGNISSYKIYRSVGDQSNFTLIATVNHPTDTYYDENINLGTQYYYAVTSVDANSNESEYSTYANVLTPQAFNLAVSANPSAGGSVTKNPNKSEYIDGEQVTLSAIANSGYQFDHWGGDITGTNATVDVTMNSDKNIVAYFTQIQYTLTLNNNPSGGGSITKDPDKTSYTYGEEVTLTASANAGYSFDQWSGDASGTSSSVTVTMDGNQSVTANYNQLQHTLAVVNNPTGGGTVTKDPDKSNYNYGEEVTLTVTANAGYSFDQWSDDASGTGSSVTVIMNGNKSVTANYNQLQYTLNISVDPSGSGSVLKDPDKTNYTYGEEVTLTASGSSGYEFDYWSGDLSGTNPSASVTINGNKNIVAHFISIRPDAPQDVQVIFVIE